MNGLTDGDRAGQSKTRRTGLANTELIVAESSPQGLVCRRRGAVDFEADLAE